MYENTALGFRIHYPRNWVVEKLPETDTGMTEEALGYTDVYRFAPNDEESWGTQAQVFVIGVQESTERITTDFLIESLRNTYEHTGSSEIEQRDSTINGFRARTIRIQSPTGQYQTVFIEGQEVIYYIDLPYNNEQSDLYESILQTFEVL